MDFKDKGAIYNERKMFIRSMERYGLRQKPVKRAVREFLGKIFYNRDIDLRAASG